MAWVAGVGVHLLVDADEVREELCTRQRLLRGLDPALTTGGEKGDGLRAGLRGLRGLRAAVRVPVAPEPPQTSSIGKVTGQKVLENCTCNDLYSVS